MEYVNLGRSGLKVSRACLGTMPDETRRDLRDHGAAHLEQMNECVEEMGLTLPDEAMKVLSDLSRPGGRS